MTLSIEIIAATPTSLDARYTLSGPGITTLEIDATIPHGELFFGPSAFNVEDNGSVHDNLTYGSLLVTSDFDQRGAPFARNNGNGVDIGAYEAQIAPSADFDSDGDVDGTDFLAWQRGFGTPNAVRADGNSDDDTDVDASDLAAWLVSYNTAPGPLAATFAGGEPVASASEFVSAAAASFRSYPAALDAALAMHQFEDNADAESVPLTDSVGEQVISYESEFPDSTLAQSEEAAEEVDFGFSDSSNSEEAFETWLSEELLEQIFA